MEHIRYHAMRVRGYCGKLDQRFHCFFIYFFIYFFYFFYLFFHFIKAIENNDSRMENFKTLIDDEFKGADITHVVRFKR